MKMKASKATPYTTTLRPNEAPRGMGPMRAALMGYTAYPVAVIPVTSEEQAAILIDVVPVIGSTMTAALAPVSASWNVLVNGVIVWTGGLARAKREATKRGGIIRPSDTAIYARI